MLNLLAALRWFERFGRVGDAAVFLLFVWTWFAVAVAVQAVTGGSFLTAALLAAGGIIVAVALLVSIFSSGDNRSGHLVGVLLLIVVWTALHYAGCDLSTGAPPGCC